ncbi:MAG TPA: CBS domain-containing protein [Actinomycetes bacterium]|nr:CBS domain-containing protein [Actinomycetes bacterium]
MRRTVQDVMTRDVVAVRGATPFKELVRLLNEHRITALPVLDAPGRVVVGVVSETDLVLKEVAPLREQHASVFETAERRNERAKAASLTAADLMTSPAVTAGPDQLVVVAARRMHDRDVKRLPVVDHGGVLVGIVTRADLLKVFLRSDEELRFDVLDHVVGDRLRLPLGSVEVDVRDGIVRLAGRVPRHSQVRMLEAVTGAIDGVVAVQSHLEWQVDDTVAQAPPAEPAPAM